MQPAAQRPLDATAASDEATASEHNASTGPEFASQPPNCATLSAVWSRVLECSAHGLEVPCASTGNLSYAYFTPFLSAMQLVTVASVPAGDAQLRESAGKGDTASMCVSPRSEEPLECAEEATTVESAHVSLSDVDADSSNSNPPASGAFTDEVSSGTCLQSSSTVRGSSTLCALDPLSRTGTSTQSTRSGQHPRSGACAHDGWGGCPDGMHAATAAGLAALPQVASPRVDPVLLAAVAGGGAPVGLRLLANWAAEGPHWERPPLYQHLQELCTPKPPASPVAAPAEGKIARSLSIGQQNGVGGIRGGRGGSAPSDKSAHTPHSTHGSSAKKGISNIPLPAALGSTPLKDLHPSSWFSILWHPLYRIPDAPLRARFITYHTVGCAGIEALAALSAGLPVPPPPPPPPPAGPPRGAGSTSSGPHNVMHSSTWLQGAPRLVGALVDTNEDSGDWMACSSLTHDGHARHVGVAAEEVSSPRFTIVRDQG